MPVKSKTDRGQETRKGIRKLEDWELGIGGRQINTRRPGLCTIIPFNQVAERKTSSEKKMFGGEAGRLEII
ncbi:hypothetical protein BK140_30355 [Paenibacillus macerans]|nr:hypothetical protein BK140_30355 [Paenibacillus macerans]